MRHAKLLLAPLCAVATLFGAGCPTEELPPSLNPNPRLFKTMFRYAAGTSPSEVAAIDVNGDNLKDLITANRGGANVSVLLAQASGGYQAKVDYATGSAPAALEILDINGDTKLDILTANAGSDDISVLLGAGDGTFAAPLNAGLLSGALPADLAVANLDADTKLDVAIACSGNDSVTILHGNGDGTFALTPQIIETGLGTRSVAIGDIDKNSFLDIVTADRDANAATVLYGQPGFTFAAPVPVSVGGNPRTVRLAKIDADDYLDLVTSNPGTGDMSVLLNDGTGAFGPETRIDVYKLPTRFVLQDFDGDSKLDIAVLLFSDGTDGAPLGMLQVLYGDGTGAFGRSRYFGAGTGAIDVQAIQLDADIRADLVVAGTSTVNVLFGRGVNGFETEERYPAGARPRAITANDFNRDGERDLAVTNLDSGDISLYFGVENSTTLLPKPRVEVSGIPRAIASGNINADSNPDIVVTNLSDNRVSVLLGKGDGTFQPERLVSIRVAGENRSSQPRSVALGDMNADGNLDIITGNAGTDSIAICLGKGDGTFEPVKEFFAFNFPLDVFVRDMNGDGKLDVIVCNGTEPDSPNATAPRVNVIFGKGDGTLDPDSRASYTTGDGPRGMVVAELNGDSSPEAITVHQGSQSVFVLAGRTGGKLTAGTNRTVAVNPNCITAGDINNDGRTDIMTTSDNEVISVLLGAGGLNFSAYVDFPIGSDPIGGALVDLNGDSRPEAIVCNRLTNDISVLTATQ